MTQNALGRIWHAFGLQPHRVENFKFSKDPKFVEKVRDMVGLYLNPPDRAIVLCVDEKSQGYRPGSRMIISGMASLLCSPPWMSPQE